jgi:hypothetical protein
LKQKEELEVETSPLFGTGWKSILAGYMREMDNFSDCWKYDNHVVKT